MNLKYIDSIKQFINVRKELGYTQGEFANLLETSQANIAKIEASKGSPNSEMVFNLITKLNISPAYLFFGIGSINNPEWNRMIENGNVEKIVLSNIVLIKEGTLLKSIFALLSTGTAINVFLCRFYKNVDTLNIHPNNAKNTLIDLIDQYSLTGPEQFFGEWVSDTDKGKVKQFIIDNFDDDEAEFMLKNSKKIHKILKKELSNYDRVFNCYSDMGTKQENQEKDHQ